MLHSIALGLLHNSTTKPPNNVGLFVVIFFLILCLLGFVEILVNPEWRFNALFRAESTVETL